MWSDDILVIINILQFYVVRWSAIPLREKLIY